MRHENQFNAILLTGLLTTGFFVVSIATMQPVWAADFESAPVDESAFTLGWSTLAGNATQRTVTADANSESEFVLYRVPGVARAEIRYTKARPGFGLMIGFSDPRNWSWLSTHQITRTGSARAESPQGRIDYKQLTLGNGIYCIYWWHDWQSGERQLGTNLISSGEGVDRILEGYACVQNKDDLADAEVAGFFASLRVHDQATAGKDRTTLEDAGDTVRPEIMVGD